jgi:hypothetical protein
VRNSGFIAHRRKGNLVLWVSFTTTHWSISFQIKARIIICNACPISKAVFRRLLLIPTHKLYTFHDLIGPVKIRRLVWRSRGYTGQLVSELLTTVFQQEFDYVYAASIIARKRGVRHKRSGLSRRSFLYTSIGQLLTGI